MNKKPENVCDLLPFSTAVNADGVNMRPDNSFCE